MIDSIEKLAQSQLFVRKGDTVVIASGENDQHQSSQRYRQHLRNEIIDQKYKIICLLGEGGMGAVYKAHHLSLDKDVALKTFRSTSLSEEAWIRFQREAQAIGRLTHQNIVQVFDFGVGEENVPYYTMECLSGESLADRLHVKGHLTQKECLSIFLQVCQALSFAHKKGIVHRDLKPANIFLAQNPSDASQSGTVKIVDFGIAGLVSQSTDAQKLTSTGSIFGSPLYMSPEQSLGLKLTERTDIYSCGCALFEALTGSPPFRGENAFATMLLHQQSPVPRLNDLANGREFPLRLDGIIGKMLAKEEDQRFQSFEELAAELENIQDGRQAKIPPPRKDGPTKRRSQPQLDGYEGTNYPKTNLPFGGKKILLLLLGAVCLVVLAVRFGLPKPATKSSAAMSNKAISKNTQPAPQSNIFDIPYIPNVISKDPDLKWDGKPYNRGIVSQGREQFTTWNFPNSSREGLGKLEVVDQKDQDGISMIGSIKTPAFAKLEYRPTGQIIRTSDLLKGFRDGDFARLNFTLLNQEEFNGLVTGLPKFQSITGLSFSSMKIKPSFEPELIKEINQYPNLTFLSVDTSIGASRLSQIRRLKKLEELRLIKLKTNIQDLFNSLSGSDKLKSLLLLDVPVTAASIKALHTCPNLRYLSVRMVDRKDPIGADALAELAGIKNLYTLNMEPIFYSQKLIDTLSKCHSLRHLVFQLNSNWHEAQIMELRRAVPDALIDVTWYDPNKASPPPYPPIR